MNNKDVRTMLRKLRSLGYKAGYREGFPRQEFEILQRPWVNTDLTHVPPLEKRHKSYALSDGRWIYAVFQPIITFKETAELIAELLNVLPELLDALEERT